VAWKKIDSISEAEYVSDSTSGPTVTWYAWSELGFRPAEWLRVGVAGQRTKTYSNERDIQRGPVRADNVGAVTIGGYWFNPGSSTRSSSA
jgi:hypothetical protein